MSGSRSAATRPAATSFSSNPYPAHPPLVTQESPFDFDFAVIGGGSAGYAAARTAHDAGLATVVIDGAPVLGGLCILRGCMPSKTLIESADRQMILQRAAEFGLAAAVGPPDIRAIRDRKRSLIDEFAGYRQGQLHDGRWILYRGIARFIDARTVEVTPMDGSASFTLRARSFCIATGSEINAPPVPGLAETGYWSSDDVLDADDLPGSFIVLGGGAIALEMAHYLHSMGREVTVVQRSPHLLSGMDRECGRIIRESYEARGIRVFCGTALKEARLDENGKSVVFTDHHGARHIINADEILLATGRQPCTASLDLPAAGVDLKHRKIVVEPTQQTSRAHIFAAGDVCSALDVVHIAIQQGEVAARNAARLLRRLDGAMEHMDYRLRLFGVFSHPQAACVGAGDEELRRDGVPFRSEHHPFNDHGKSMVMGEVEGIVKLSAHAETGEILGGVCVGPHATELIHEITVAMHFRATVHDLARIPHYHPTLSEIWTYPAESLAAQIAEINA